MRIYHKAKHIMFVFAIVLQGGTHNAWDSLLKGSSMAHTGVRPCAGHHFLRRRKNCILVFAIVIIMTCTVLQMLEDGVTYTPLRPLSGATDEARRLLKFITHYNYACNMTIHAFNHTQWQICVDHDVGLDLEAKDSNKIVYSIR